MAENSRTTKYADGTDVTPAPMTYGTPVTTYGYLYNYYAATKTTPPTRSTRAAVADGQGICPDGWHIPDDEDFADLMSHYEAEDLMSDQHWLTPGTNVAGFGLEPAGMYNAELAEIVITPTSDGVTGVLNVLATALTNDFDYAFAPAAHASNYQTPTITKGTLTLLPRTITLRSKSWTQNYTGSAIRKDEVSILGMGFVGTEGINAPTWDYMDANPCIDVKVDGENNVIGYDNIFAYTLKTGTLAT